MQTPPCVSAFFRVRDKLTQADLHTGPGTVGQIAVQRALQGWRLCAAKDLAWRLC